MRSLRTKLVMIMVILILALMCVIGAFLINGVGNFYISQFYEQMEKTFSPEFIGQLQEIPAQEQNAPERMKELLMAQAGLGIDIATRNVYILDETGNVLASSNQQTSVSMTANLLTAMNGEVGQESSITSSFMDLAVPIASADSTYIVYILDSRATVDALTGELFSIILSALGLGLVICVVLSFLLAQILITPIRALTLGTRQVAAGDFSQRIEVEGQDEIGVLTRNFNHMAKVLQDTISEAENERNKLSTLFLHMTDGVVAFSASGNLIHCNPAATQMLARPLDPTTTFDELFADQAELDTLLTLKRPQYLEAQKTAGDRELELFMAPFSSGQEQGGVMVVISTGMTFVVATGEMDISVGAIYNLVVNCMALMILHWGINPWLAAVLGILLGIFCGGINGLIGVFLGLPMIIITLGSSYIYKGLTSVLTGGYSVGNLGQSSFFDFGVGSTLGINNTVYVAIAVVLISAWWLRNSVMARDFLAMGSNKNAALYSGVPIKLRKVQNELLMGAFAGLSGVLSLSFMASATSEGGSGYEMLAITAVVAGGGSTDGGTASVWGTLGGIALIMIIKNGLMLMGISTAYQQATEGILLVLAIALQRLTNRKTR